MSRASESTQTAEDLELVINRVFDAPRSRVWQAWTDPGQMKIWSSPHGFSVPASEGELRPGGRWSATMRQPDGSLLHLGGECREVVEPERLVFTHAWRDERGNPQGPETVVTVILKSRGNKTEMTFRQSGFDSAGSRDGHAGGWTQCFERLEEMLAGSA